MLNDLKTCLTLLRRTELQSLLNVFDNILKLHCYPSALPENEATITTNQENEQIQSQEELSKLSQYAIDEFKIVQIEKTHQPLGLTISRTDSGTIHIARIVVGGIAATTQLFQINDRILEINDQPITGHSLDYVCTLMSNITGLIKFLLSPPKNSNQISYKTFHVRALYAYDPFNDSLIPCKELGLAFNRGDILRIVARDENVINWWQAYRENSDDSSLAGLIPSDSLQQKRVDLFQAISDDTDTRSIVEHPKKMNKTCFTCVSSKQERKPLQTVYDNSSFIDDKESPTIRTSTNHFSLTDTRQFDEEQPSTTFKRFSDKNKEISDDSFRFYEPVLRLDLSTQHITRPIVLLGKKEIFKIPLLFFFFLGAPNVGRHELRRRLLENNPNLFDVAIPHTTRARRLQEMPDIDYHFVSEADFLAKVACHSFIEFGQYDRDLYGTSIDDIRHIVKTKQKICILNLNPDAIRTFEKSDLYPYIICIAAPSFERLKRLELDRRESLTDTDYREIIRQSRSIERRHYLLFDQILINNDLDRTYLELQDLIVRIQHDNQQWVRTSYRRL
jgi:MAGUK p55 subfamily protein 5